MWEFFQTVKQLLKGIGIELAIIVAGVLGAFASVSRDKKMTVVEKVISIISGGVVANYLTPIIVEWTKAGENTKYGIGFVLGYTGLKSVEWVIDKFKAKIEKTK